MWPFVILGVHAPQSPDLGHCVMPTGPHHPSEVSESRGLRHSPPPPLSLHYCYAIGAQQPSTLWTAINTHAQFLSDPQQLLVALAIRSQPSTALKTHAQPQPSVTLPNDHHCPGGQCAKLCFVTSKSSFFPFLRPQFAVCTQCPKKHAPTSAMTHSPTMMRKTQALSTILPLDSLSHRRWLWRLQQHTAQSLTQRWCRCVWR